MRRSVVAVLLLVLGLVLVNAQTSPQGGSRLNATFVNLIPFCDQEQPEPPGSAYESEICSDRQEPLKCKILLDQTNNREFVGLVHGKGIAFYHVDARTHATKLVAQYEAECSKLMVVGLWNNFIVISSSKAESEEEDCPALGLGFIDTSDWPVGSGNDTSEEEPINVDVTPNTQFFSFAESILSSKDQGNTTNVEDWFLAVFGASNETGSANPQDLFLKSVTQPQTGNATTNATEGEPSFELLFKGSFPFQLNPRWSVLWKKPTSTAGNTTLWMVGPVASEQGTNQTEQAEGANAVEIWSIFGNSTGGNQTFSPQRVATIPAEGAKFVALSPNGNALYLAQMAQLRGNETQQGNVSSTRPDMLTVLDISNLDSIRIAANVTYEQMKEGVQGGNTTGTPEEKVPKITALKAGGRLWTGWNTGELFIHDISTDPLSPTLQFFGDIFSLSEENLGGENTTSNGSGNVTGEGINDICPYVIGPQARAFVTATPINQQGKLFMGVGPAEEGEPQPTATATALPTGGVTTPPPTTS